MRSTLACQALFLSIVSLGACATAPSLRDGPEEQSLCEIESAKFQFKYLAMRPRMDEFGEYGFFRTRGDGGLPHPVPDYRDPLTGITFHVESDGRHLVAKNANGELIWRRNPFVDSKMCPYRSPHPYIDEIGPLYYNGLPWSPEQDAAANAEMREHLRKSYELYPTVVVPGTGEILTSIPPRDDDRFISLSFNSSQAGTVNIRTGDFDFSRQD